MEATKKVKWRRFVCACLLLLLGFSMIGNFVSFDLVPTVKAQDDPPYYTTISTNTTRAGRPCLFRVLWWDDVGLSGFIFGTNNTGSWQNESWTDPWSGTPIAGYADTEKTLNETEEILIQWRVWANDTSNNWNNTGIQSLTTTGPNRFVDPNCGTSLTGTLNFTYLSTAVNGTGTLFTEEVYQSGVGCPAWLFIRPDGPTPASWYQVSLVTNNTYLTLKRYFLNDTLTTTAKVNKNEGLTTEAAACHIAQLLEFRTPEAPTTIYLRRNTTHHRYIQDHAISIKGNGTEGNPITLMGDDGTGWAGETGLPKPVFNYSDSFTVDHKQYWVFKDFEFVEGYESTGPWQVKYSSNITFEAVDFHHNIRATHAIVVQDSYDVSFKQCTFHDNYDDPYSGCDAKIYGPSTVYLEDCVFNTGTVQYAWSIIICSEPSTLYIRDTTFGVTTSYKIYDLWSNTGAEESIAYVYNVTFTTGVDNVDVRDWLEIPPTYSNIGTNTTLAGNPAKFHVFWQHEDGLSGYIYGTNNTGTWQNESWTDPWSGEPTEGWSNVTKTLNSTVGVTVEFQFWCNNTNAVWGTTGTKFLTTTSGEISIEVDQISVSTLRINVGVEVYIYFHSRFNNNQSSCTTGNLYVNTTEYSINNTGWTSLSISSEIVTKKIYTVTGANVNGETDYQQIPPDPEIIWDRLEVFSCGVSDEWAVIGSVVIYWWKLRYDYDDVAFDVTKGSVDIGGNYASWNSSLQRWERSVTLPSTLQNYSQNYPQLMTFSDLTYDLTAMTGTTSQSVTVSIFTIQTLEDYNRNLQNSGLPYISAGTNYITALFYSGDTQTFTVDASSGITSKTKIYCVDKGRPAVVGATTVSWSEVNRTVTISKLHSSSATITVEWGEGSYSPPGPLPTRLSTHLTVELDLTITAGEVVELKGTLCDEQENTLPNTPLLVYNWNGTTYSIETNDIGITHSFSELPKNLELMRLKSFLKVHKITRVARLQARSPFCRKRLRKKLI